MRCLIKLYQEYDTVKYVKVKNKKVGLLNRLLQLIVVVYIVGYVLVINKGYQVFSDVRGTVLSKVKGVAYTNFSDDEFENEIEDPSIYRRSWDALDVVQPPLENNALFVATNILITPEQKLSTCAESWLIEAAVCDPENNTCTPGRSFFLGNGITTGKCIQATNKTELIHTCEIRGWCPVEINFGPLKDVNNTPRALLNETGDFTVLLKNFIEFPLYDASRSNYDDTREDYFPNCRYDPIEHRLCPVFVIKNIVMEASSDYNLMAPKGGVISIEINWDCNLDYSIDCCIPKYSFKRLDNPRATAARGWNFRYSNNYSNQTRSLYKLYGIDFVIIITGRGGRFNIVPLLLNVGAGLALMTLVSVICDIFILYVLKKRSVYLSTKYTDITADCERLRNDDMQAHLVDDSILDQPS